MEGMRKQYEQKEVLRNCLVWTLAVKVLHWFVRYLQRFFEHCGDVYRLFIAYKFLNSGHPINCTSLAGVEELGDELK